MINFRCNYGKIASAELFASEMERVPGYLEELKKSPMGGWIELPENYDREEFARIKAAAEKINSDSDYLVCAGIGGSYLGHKAAIGALGGETGRAKILYVGNSLSTRELKKVLATLGDADFSINVISKSGTTTETAVAFRIFREKLVTKYGEEGAAQRIYATTDAERGALHDEAVNRGYERFVVPDNIGGRFSVLTAVGLLPMAVAGVDIEAMMRGAAAERAEIFEKNGGRAAEYAMTRKLLNDQKYKVEVMANFEPSFSYFNEWWKQLFGESEGKNRGGIFPASVISTTDLHSMGQYLQDGARDIFETVLEFEEDDESLTIPEGDDADGLGYLVGRSIASVNRVAKEATIGAHRDEGEIPVLRVTAPRVDAETLGALFYFFEMSCALSATAQGVNPFDQPGVEAYKRRMFKLLGKPGF
ncbi:glucose-6-phosphate isomerase [Candidatus Saccharibacteria bacterium]|nr:glucose-6-phosphate isomerase [Candidatus Saccharibacteria bacterium]